MAGTVAFRGGSGASTYHSYNDSDNTFIYDTIAYPLGNFNILGSRVVSIDSAAVAGGAGITSITVSSDGYVRVYCGTPRLNFDRNPAAGGGITKAADGYVWAGGLCGYFTWTSVPSPVVNFTAVRSGRDVLITLISGSADNGGRAVSSYRVQRRSALIGSGPAWGPWGDDHAVGTGPLTYTYAGLAPGYDYQFRMYANNSLGDSAATVGSIVTVPPAGKRKVGGVWVDTDIAKRKKAGAWVDLTIAKRKVAGAWVNL